MIKEKGLAAQKRTSEQCEGVFSEHRDSVSSGSAIVYLRSLIKMICSAKDDSIALI